MLVGMAAPPVRPEPRQMSRRHRTLEVDCVDGVRYPSQFSTSQINWAEGRPAVREIQASAAKAHLLQLLDDVGLGDVIVITRHGRAIARLISEVDRRREEIDQAIASIRALRQRTGKVTVEELLSARHEGHRY